MGCGQGQPFRFELLDIRKIPAGSDTRPKKSAQAEIQPASRRTPSAGTSEGEAQALECRIYRHARCFAQHLAVPAHWRNNPYQQN